MTTAIYGQGRYGHARYGRIFISGTTTLTFTTSGFLMITVPISGTTNLTFDVFAHLTTYRYASGTTSLSFNTWGKLVGAGSLSGTASLSFTVTGNLHGHEAPYEYNNIPQSGPIYTDDDGLLGLPFPSYGVQNPLPLYELAFGPLDTDFPKNSIVNPNKPFKEEN